MRSSKSSLKKGSALGLRGVGAENDKGRTLVVLRALGDETRLKICALLQKEPLHVSEILALLGMGQSRISRHLKILANAGIVEWRREGSFVYYGINHSAFKDAWLVSFFESFQKNNAEDKELKQKLASLLERRRKESVNYFQTYGEKQETLQSHFVDARFYRKKILSLVPKASRSVVDLGCGTGELSLMLASKAKQVIGVDQSSRMLKIARNSFPAGDFRIGSLDHLPLRDGEADVVIASMVLHHLPDPSVALKEVYRVMSRSGLFILSELEHHEEESMRIRFADFWYGFDVERLQEVLRGNGLKPVSVKYGSGRGKLNCIFLTARKIKVGK